MAFHVGSEVTWGKKTAEIAEGLIVDIGQAIKSDMELRCKFEKFLKSIRDTLNPKISETEAVEMLAQHTLTLPIFQKFFPDLDFHPQNTIWEDMHEIAHRLHRMGVMTQKLNKLYAALEQKINLTESARSRQNLMRSFYDTFLQTTFPHMADRLGIVYTPVEVVDFILKSVQFALKKYFGCDIGDDDVQILDPFVGTGTFLVRLIQLDLIEKNKLSHKYAKEMHANEILLLPYYTASVNVTTAYHAATGEYKPFSGITLGDTFLLDAKDD
jgi:predicted helicase